LVYNVAIVDHSAEEACGGVECISGMLEGTGGSGVEVILTSTMPVVFDQPGIDSSAACRLTKPLGHRALHDCLLAALHRTEPRGDATVIVEQAVGLKWHILLAEDNLVNQKLAIGFLEKMGHHGDLAVNGLHAVGMCQGKNYDAILMDLQMPLMGGLEATTKIREMEKTTGRHTRILAMTAHATVQDRQECLNAGMDGYLTKPISKKSLRSEMERVIMNDKSVPETLARQEVGSQETNWSLPELLERLENDRAFLVELLAVFRQDSHVALEQAQDALSKRDMSTLERRAHSLKGMQRNLLMERAANIASELEIAARQDRAQDCVPLVGQLRTALEQLAPEIDAQMQEVKA
jgi:two-component system, sensor histidine kinase and response regulator